MPVTSSDSKFDMILEKGLMIMWSKGYNGTSVNDIVKAADIPKGSFYFYFNSKEDFAVKAIERYFQMQLVPAMKVLNDETVSPRQRLINFYEYRVKVLKEELHLQMGCLASNLGSEMADHSEKIRQVILEKTTLVKESITKVARLAQEAGEMDDKMPADKIVAFLEDAGRGAMVSMKEVQDSAPVDNVVNMLKTIFLK